MQKILFDSRAGMLPPFLELTKYFQEENSALEIITKVNNRYERKLYEENDLLVGYVLQDYVDENIKHYKKRATAEVLSQLKSIEKKYSIPNFFEMGYQDRFMVNFNPQKLYLYMLLISNFWIEIIENEQPDFVVTEGVSGFSNYILYYLCKNEIHFISLFGDRFLNRFRISYNQYGHFKDLTELYRKKSSEQTITDEVNTFINNIHSKISKPSYMLQATKGYNVGVISAIKFLIKLSIVFKHWAYGNNDYTSPTPLKYYYSALRNMLYNKAYKFYFKFYRKADFKTDYFLFPLHFQPEASTSVWAPFYTDQLSVIRNISQCIPIGFKLYVKEHSSFLGSRKFKFYKEIQKIHNVILVSPLENIFELIENSQAVIAITSTTALESFFFKKPTFVLGNVFFDIVNGIQKVDNFYELREKLYKYYDYTPLVEDINRFTNAYLNSGYEAYFNTSDPDGIIKNDNIRKIADYLLKIFNGDK